MEEVVKTGTCLLGSLVEGLAAIVIAQGILQAIAAFVVHNIRNTGDVIAIRLSLGKLLALALELLLAADILRTAVAPTWEDIGKLAAIAVLRTLLNFFLERELKHD